MDSLGGGTTEVRAGNDSSLLDVMRGREEVEGRSRGMPESRQT